MRSADSGIVIQFVDGEAKCRARVRTASGYDVACDLNEYKNGGLGCSSGDTKVLGHACAHLMAVATKGGNSIEDFHPHHKTTAHLKEIMRAAGKYPTPPDEETIQQHKAKFEVRRFVSRVIKAKSGRKKRHKKAKEIAMKKKAAKAAKAR